MQYWLGCGRESNKNPAIRTSHCEETRARTTRSEAGQPRSRWSALIPALSWNATRGQFWRTFTSAAGWFWRTRQGRIGPLCPKTGFPGRPAFVSNELRAQTRHGAQSLGQFVPLDQDDFSMQVTVHNRLGHIAIGLAIAH